MFACSHAIVFQKTLYTKSKKKKNMREPFHILKEKKTLMDMCFFLYSTVFRGRKHSLTLKRDLCCHGNIRNKTREARHRTFSIRYSELIITKEECGRYCLTCLIGWKDTVCDGQAGRVAEQRQRKRNKERERVDMLSRASRDYFAAWILRGERNKEAKKYLYITVVCNSKCLLRNAWSVFLPKWICTLHTYESSARMFWFKRFVWVQTTFVQILI